MNEDLTQSSHTGVRWQAQMELHLAQVRGIEAALSEDNGAEMMKHPNTRWYAACRTDMAVAHGLAAIALAIASSVGDLELPLSKIATAVIATAVEGMGD